MKTIDKLLGLLLLFTVLLMGSQWGMPFPPGKKPLLFVAYVDLLLGATFALWALKVLVSGTLKEIRLPPASFLVLAAVAVLSCAFAEARKDALKETIQIIEFFVVGGLVFTNGFRSSAEWRRAIFAAGIAATAIVLLGLFQYFTSGNAFLIRGSLANKNAFGMFLALALPFFFGFAHSEKNPAISCWWTFLLVPGLLVTLTAGAVMGILVGTLLAAGFHSRRSLLLTSAAWALLLSAGPRLFLRAGQGQLLHNSISFYIPSNAYFTPAAASEHLKNEIVKLDEEGQPEGDYNVGRDFLAYYEGLYPGDPGLEPGKARLQKVLDVFNEDLEEGDEKYTLDLTTQPKPVINTRYIRWHAAWELIRSNRCLGFFGAGPGNFREAVNKAYPAGGPLRKPSAEGRGGAYDTFGLTSNEPDSFNQYLVYAAELGFLGLMAFLWAVFGGLADSVRALRSEDPTLRGLGAGVFAGLCSALVTAVFHPLVVRGLGLVLVFLLCAARFAADKAGEIKADE